MLVKVLYKILKKVVDNCDKFYLEETDPDVMEAKELLGRMEKSDERGWRKKMTIDEAIKHAKEVAGDSRCTECAKEIAKQLASWLEELKELREKSKWIPCSERMLESGEYVLVSFENDGIILPDIATYQVDQDGNGAFYPSDNFVTYASVGLYVNAWMPLPEPYREDE